MTDEPEIHLHDDPDERNSQVAVPNASLPRQIIVRSGVLDAVDAHLAADSSIEHGGVLVGSGDATSGVVVITGSIKALHTKGTVASLTFTHETWDYVSQVMDTGFPGQKIVGWYHSHPTFGVFLSEYDLFIQRNFFPEPWQIAYVFDPVYDQRGFFGWENGEIVRIPTWESTTSQAGVEAAMPVNVPSRREPRSEPIAVEVPADPPAVPPPPPPPPPPPAVSDATTVLPTTPPTDATTVMPRVGSRAGSTRTTTSTTSRARSGPGAGRKRPGVIIAAIVLGLVGIGLVVFALTRGDDGVADPDDTSEVSIDETDPTTGDTDDEAPEETAAGEVTTTVIGLVPTTLAATTVPVVDPLVTTPPVTQPPATQPPATQPPATQPPVTQPPVTTAPSPGGQPVVTIETSGGVEAVELPFAWDPVEDQFFPDCTQLSSIGRCVLVDGRFGVEVTTDNDDDRPTLPNPDTIRAFLAQFVNRADDDRTIILFESPDDSSATLQKVMCQSEGVWEVQALDDVNFADCDDTTWAALDLEERRAVCPDDEECLRADVVWVPATYTIASGAFPVPVLVATEGDAVLVCVEADGTSDELESASFDDDLATRQLQPGDECAVEPQIGGGRTDESTETTDAGNG